MSSCLCGYQDEDGRLYTDATIVYLNETDAQNSFSQDFEIASFLNEYEDGFSTTYRQSAEPANVAFINGTCLELLCNVPTSQRVVVGGQIATRRKDIQYGSFRSGLAPPPSNLGGTALTMEYNFNISQKISLDVLNQDTQYNTRIEYSVGLPGATLSPYSSNNSLNPFMFYPNEYRFDWNDKKVNFSTTLNGSATWEVEKTRGMSMPSIPGAITFRHWSDGDPLHAQGPPEYTTESGKITYIRLFYNGTTTSPTFESTCRGSGHDVCRTDDVSLRGSSSYPPEALIPWKLETPEFHANKVATFTALVPLGLFIMIVIHAVCARTLRYIKSNKVGRVKNPEAYVYVMDKSQGNVEKWSVPRTEVEDTKSPSKSEESLSKSNDDSFSVLSLPTLYEIDASPSSTSVSVNTIKAAYQAAPRIEVSEVTDKRLANKKVIQPSRPRMDYLDGFRGIVCMLVSLIHFCLTFYIGAINPSTPIHYSLETWFRKIASPVLLNASIVLGCFFILSARLIGVRYLRNGNLEELAGSTFRRIPRLFIPVMMAVTLEYFLITVNATQWLRYLASVSWSTWPYTTAFENAGFFFDELLALLFIIPNALPRIIYNYCTGVLWTIPVNVQYSWLCYLGVVVIRESNTTWKRFAYYAICIFTNWYALNWGAYFWIGLAIGDLDSTYKYRTWFTSIWRKSALMIFLWGTILSFMVLQYLQQVDIVNFPTLEYGIHPDIYTGLPINQTALSGFPPFNYPQVYAFFIGSALIVLCDMSSLTQKLFSYEVLRTLGKHSYSVYLLHGAIFWTWGSWLTIRLHVAGAPYWATTLVVFVTSYTMLFFACYVWTPVADVYAMIISTSLWRYVQGKSLYKTIS